MEHLTPVCHFVQILADAVTNILLAMTKKDIVRGFPLGVCATIGRSSPSIASLVQVPFQLLAIKILWALSADFDACHLIGLAANPMSCSPISNAKAQVQNKAPLRHIRFHTFDGKRLTGFVGELANAGGVARLLNLLKEGGSPTNDHRMLSLDA
eukprot:34671-Rhodomonas_salina.2